MPPENVPSETVGAPSSGCSGASKREVLEPPDRPRELVDRVLAQVRHRAVRRLPARHRVRPHHALVRDARVVRGRLGHQHRAAARPAARRRAQRQRALAAGLLTRAQHELEPRRRRAAQRRHPLGRDDDRRRPALHVARAAPEQPVAVGLAGERVDRPVRLPSGTVSRCPVRHSDGPVRHAPARDERRAPGVELVRRDREPGRLQARPDQRRGLGLVAGRVDRAGRDELARELDDVGRSPRSPTGSGAGSARCRRGLAAGPRRPPRPRGRSPSARRARRTGARCRCSDDSFVPRKQPRNPIGMREDRRVVEGQRAERRRRARPHRVRQDDQHGRRDQAGEHADDRAHRVELAPPQRQQQRRERHARGEAEREARRARRR